MVKKCIYCGKEISQGRSDRKFCNSNCRASYHNSRAYYSSAPVSGVIRSLERNYNILCDIISSGNESASMGDLVDEGFRPEYVTSYMKVRGGDELRCFDIRYRQSGLKIFNVRKKEESGVVIETNLVPNE
ncbi:MAG: hypothetical protein MJZ16_01080 [Bacteroidales bacterium]|nr:hypothetical protein [Bacteroidales bacterium]